MPRPFPPTIHFQTLALKDLLDARESYHAHLAHLENVVATAVGLYRIRRADLDPSGVPKKLPAGPRDAHSPPRTLGNSRVVAGYSWPCVLVFVKEWVALDDFRHDPDEVIPRRLYLPDGRIVPVCVVLAERADVGRTAPPLPLPGGAIGGGYPVFSDVQGQQQRGTIGCLVTDGNMNYVLTNRHVTGPGDRESYTLLRGERVRLGVSDGRQVGKVPFTDVYPGWPGARSVCNLDAGLIRLDDLDDWTAQVYGVGEIGEPVDLNVDTLSLDLIGTPVRGFGGSSGPIFGEVQALFYRYQSLGGLDYVTELLIGPRDEKTPVQTHPGDSGTLWFYDPPPPGPEVVADKHEPVRGARAPRLRPLALQWGSHRLLGAGSTDQVQTALATCVSSICRALDVELVRDWNIGLGETWGKTGHYKIGAKACELPDDDRLRKLLLANQGNIAFDDDALSGGHLGGPGDAFVPLADVADLVWRTSRPTDESNHFADMDFVAEDGKFAGKDLLALCEDEANVAPHVWNEFYESIGENKKRGALPFRIWQMYADMVKYLKAGDVARFVAAGGLMSHYAGDACQPLHVSRWHHGRTAAEKNVHGDYETKMLDRFAADLVARVNERLKDRRAAADVEGGHQAAVSVVGLMRSTIGKLPPLTVVETWVEAAGRTRLQQMWEALGERTADCVADGCLRLAALWASAWKEGGGEHVPDAKLAAVDKGTLSKLYRDKTFVPSLTLADLEASGLLSGGASASGAAAGARPRPRPHRPRGNG
jgi:hypothetical protein